MPVIGIRELSRDTSRVIKDFERTGEPVVVTREGRPIGALVPVDQEQFEDLVLATAPEFRRSRRRSEKAVKEGRTRSVREVARERGVKSARRSPKGRELTEWAREVAASEFAPFRALYTRAIVEHTVDAAGEIGEISEEVARAIEDQGGSGEPLTDDLRHVTELNVGIYASLLRKHLASAVSAEPDDVESAIAATVRRAKEGVRVINQSIAESHLDSVTSYEGALRGFRVACERAGPADFGVRLERIVEG
jgi:prevent-host-death family protein